MKFQLNVDKSSYLSVGKTVFTFEEPLKEINLEHIGSNEFNQLLFNCRSGVLACEDPSKLLSMVKAAPQPIVQPPVAPSIPPTQPIQVLVADPVEEDLKPLRALLKQKVSSIIKALPALSIGRCRKLAELEKAGKNRKQLMGSIHKVLEKHAASLPDAVGEEDTGNKTFAMGVQQIDSPQVSDIIESDIEEVEIKPGDERVIAADLPDHGSALYPSQWKNDY